MKTNRLIVAGLASLLLLAGCRSSKHVARTTDADTSATQLQTPPVSDTEVGRTGTPETVSPSQEAKGETTDAKEEKGRRKNKKDKKETSESQQPTQQKTTADAVTAKLSLTLKAGSKKISLGGNYRLKRNEVVQMNLNYQVLFVSINIGTLELTPDYVMVIDRYHKRYCKATYAELPSLGQAGIDFNYLQSIFWGEAGESPTPSLEWAYDGWQTLGDGQFPGKIEFSLKSSSTAYKATFNLSNLSTDSDWPTRTTLGSGYTPMSLDSVMRLLMSVAK